MKCMNILVSYLCGYSDNHENTKCACKETLVMRCYR